MVAVMTAISPFWRDVGRFYEWGRSWWVAGTAVLAAAVTSVLFWVLAAGIDTRLDNVGLSLQKSFTVERFARAVEAVGGDVQVAVRNIVTLDFAFPVIYAVALSSVYALAAGPGPSRHDLWVFSLPWAAALLDIGENLVHLSLLADVHTAADLGKVTAGPVLTASLLASAKYTLIFVTLGAITWQAGRRRLWWVSGGAILVAAGFIAAIIQA